ncbi:MAG: class I SAM-dependent methyltransferase [Cyclobacteriaceae bacterium]
MKSISLTMIAIAMMMFAAHGQHKQHGGNEANKYMHKRSFEELTERFEDKSRDQWQKPEQVIALMGDIKGKTVVDLGAGTGYFAFKLADHGAKVIAADVDDDFQNFIKVKKEELKFNDDQISLKKIPFDSPELVAGQTDVVLIVNTYHHIEDRVPYFKEILDGLTDDGYLMNVDFIKKEFKESVPGPPMAHRISKEQVIEELKKSGFARFEVDTDLLPFQYVIRAYRK